MKEYTIRVPYDYTDCCYHTPDRTAEVTLFAKSEEQAREKAKEYVNLTGNAHRVHSTTVLEVEDV